MADETVREEVERIDAAESADLLGETEVAEESTAREYIEFLGDPDNPLGTAFLNSHTMEKGDPAWKRLGVKPTKDLTWERDPFGPAIGFKGNRLLLPVEDIDPAVATALEKVPGFKRVTVE